MRLAELIDVSVLRDLAEANFRASGMPIGLIDAVDGSVLIAFGWQEICTMYHRANALSADRCRESDEYIKGHLSEAQPCEYTCKNGLRDIGIPVRVAGQHLATLFLGQFFYEGEQPDRAFFVEQAKRFGFDEAAYLTALDRVPVFSRERVANVLKYNVALASFVSGICEAAQRRAQAESRSESLARFPEENPEPVIRLAQDLSVAYANDAAVAAFAPHGLIRDAPAPKAIRDLAISAISDRGRVQREVTSGGRAFSVTAIAIGTEVNAYAHDITERVRAEREIQAANRAKDEFLAMLSHELRNPLAPIRNSLYVLEHADPMGQRAHRAREVAGRQLAHLTRLVDDLLDMTRIIQGRVELRRAELDLAELARRTAEDHRSLMHERGLEFGMTLPAQPVWVDGDETRLAQVIGNLLQNAIKFTPEGGRVTLAVATEGDWAELRVTDTGKGIAPELLERVFDPFVQGEHSLARSEGGLGLGLALVKGLVAMHGGTSAARSAGPGRGAEFLARFPLRPAPSTRTEPVDEASAPLTAGLRVLVVDDNQDAAESLADLVRILGHDAQVAFDGESAIEMANAAMPDIVLCDIGLPGLSGYEVAQRLRSDRRFDGVHLVAVSGYAAPEDRARAIEAGFMEHIAKPPDPGKVLRVLAGRGSARPA